MVEIIKCLGEAVKADDIINKNFWIGEALIEISNINSIQTIENYETKICEEKD